MPLAVYPALQSAQDPRQGAVVPTLAETLSWIRRCARQQPTLRLQVLLIFLVGTAPFSSCSYYLCRIPDKICGRNAFLLQRAIACLLMQVLVTGSLYLVGDMLRLLGRAPS